MSKSIGRFGDIPKDYVEAIAPTTVVKPIACMGLARWDPDGKAWAWVLAKSVRLILTVDT